MPIKISVLVPTYNQSKFIRKTILSILNQTYKNIEIIIGDDCSSEDIKSVVNDLLDYNVKYIRNDVNIGRVRNYHKLLYTQSTGDYVINIDGDDLLTDPLFFERAVCHISCHNDKNVLYVACKAFSNEGKITYNIHEIANEIECISGVDFVVNIFNKYKFSHLTTLYNREHAKYVGFYDLDCLSTDVNSILKYSLSSSVILDKNIVGQWHSTGNNESHFSNVEAYVSNLVWINIIYKQLKFKTNLTIATLWKYRVMSISLEPILFFLSKRPSYIFNSLRPLICILRNPISMLILVFKRLFK